MVTLLVCLLLILNLIHSGWSDTIVCGQNECVGETLNCTDDGSTCTVNCAPNGCNSATVNCANGYDCDIVLSGDDSGNKIIINGNNASRLDITTGINAYNQLYLANIFCAPNVDCIIRCNGVPSTGSTCAQAQIHGKSAGFLTLECGNSNSACDLVDIWCPDNGICQLSGQPDTSAMTNLEVYSIQGFSTVIVENGNTGNSIGIMKCTPRYNQNCYIDANPASKTANNACVGYPHICDNSTIMSTTSNPTNIPTMFPTNIPTMFPTNIPTMFPTNTPSKIPTNTPSKFPTTNPSKFPTDNPTDNPLTYPTNNPSKSPTKNPTTNPTTNPTLFPTKQPTFNPTSSTQSAAEGEIEDTAKNEDANDEGDDQKQNINGIHIIKQGETVIFILIVVVGVMLICIVVGFMIWCIQRNKKRKSNMGRIIDTIGNKKEETTMEMEMETNKIMDHAKNQDDSSEKLYNEVDILTPIGDITSRDENVHCVYNGNDDNYDNDDNEDNDQNTEELYENYSTPAGNEIVTKETSGNDADTAIDVITAGPVVHNNKTEKVTL